MSAQIEYRDISQQVASMREQLELPAIFAFNGNRYPVHNPKVLLFDNSTELSKYAVWLNQSRLSDSPDKSPTFPTGGTWEKAYEIMAALPEISRLLRQRRIATIDEYYPIRPTDINFPMSYKFYTDERIGKLHGIRPENWIRPNGAAEDPLNEAARFESELAQTCFAITNLGIGPDPKLKDGSMIPRDWDAKAIEAAVQTGEAIEGSPHIGFVPKGILPDSGAIYVAMDRGTIFANSKYAPDPGHMPEHAISQAHGDFLRADLRVLAANGEFKQRNIEQVLFEAPTPDNPASMVTLGDTVILLDAKAAGRTMKRLGLAS